MGNNSLQRSVQRALPRVKTFVMMLYNFLICEKELKKWFANFFSLVSLKKIVMVLFSRKNGHYYLKYDVSELTSKRQNVCYDTIQLSSLRDCNIKIIQNSFPLGVRSTPWPEVFFSYEEWVLVFEGEAFSLHFQEIKRLLWCYTTF